MFCRDVPGVACRTFLDLIQLQNRNISTLAVVAHVCTLLTQHDATESSPLTSPHSEGVEPITLLVVERCSSLSEVSRQHGEYNHSKEQIIYSKVKANNCQQCICTCLEFGQQPARCFLDAIIMLDVLEHHRLACRVSVELIQRHTYHHGSDYVLDLMLSTIYEQISLTGIQL